MVEGDAQELGCAVVEDAAPALAGVVGRDGRVGHRQGACDVGGIDVVDRAARALQIGHAVVVQDAAADGHAAAAVFDAAAKALSAVAEQHTVAQGEGGELVVDARRRNWAVLALITVRVITMLLRGKL